MYPSIDIRIHDITHTHTVTHKLFVHYTVTSPLLLHNHKKTRERLSSSRYVLFFQTFISCFSFIHNRFIYLHLPAKLEKNKTQKTLLYKYTHDRMITIMVMICAFDTFLPLVKFNNEIYSSMPTIGEIEGEGEREELDICLIK